MTSLAVGVPLVVPPAFLEVYSEFKREHVVVVVRGEQGGGHVGSMRERVMMGEGGSAEGRERDRWKGEGEGEAGKGVRCQQAALAGACEAGTGELLRAEDTDIVVHASWFRCLWKGGVYCRHCRGATWGHWQGRGSKRITASLQPGWCWPEL